jgi:uncharacterized protein (UPF0276 family)
MPEIYATWCEGLPSDKEALSVIKKSGSIAGIEICHVDNEINQITEFGLKYNLHNPLRQFHLGLENGAFIPTMIKYPNVVKALNESGPVAVGFHSGYSAISDKNSLSEAIVSNTLRSIKFLDEVVQKKILFETVPYTAEFANAGNKEALFYVTSPEYMKRLITKGRAGLLIDISHNYVSGMHKIKEGLFKGEIQDYFASILSQTANDVYQVHLNVPSFDSQKWYYDSHSVIKPSQKISKEILLIAEEIVGLCPNLKVVTLEMTTNLDPKKHAKIMVKQAELVNKLILHK